MLQVRGQILSCFVIGVLVFAASALAGQVPSTVPEPLQSPAVSSPAQTPASPDQAPALVGQPQPIFLSPLSECRAACYADFQSCKMHNPYSFCLQLYNGCVCLCNDSCYP